MLNGGQISDRTIPPAKINGAGFTPSAPGDIVPLAFLTGYTGTALSGITAALDTKSNTGHTHTFSSLTGTPTTLSGYGITDGLGIAGFLSYTGSTQTALSGITSALAGKSDTGHTHTFGELTNKPATLSGYGITDGLGSATFTIYTGQTQTALSGITAALAAKSDTGHTHTFGELTQKPTTLSGYGITDGVSQPVFNIYTGQTQTALSGKSDTGHTHTFTELTGKPVTLSGYGITDAYTKVQTDAAISGATPNLTGYYTTGQTNTLLFTKSDTGHTHTFGELTNKPVTLSGYGIADAVTQPVFNTFTGQTQTQLSGITSALSGKSDTGHTHAFNELTGKPTTLSGYGITDGLGQSIFNTFTGQTQTALSGKSDTGHTHTFQSITSRPVTLSGYGITDAVGQPAFNTFTGQTQVALSGKSDTGHTHTFASLTARPTTLSGYGITDGFTGHTAGNGIALSGNTLSVRLSGNTEMSGLAVDGQGLRLDIATYRSNRNIDIATDKTLKISNGTSAFEMGTAAGMLDQSWTNRLSGFNDAVYALAVQPDGKTIVAGGFTLHNGTSTPYIIRLNIDGSRDNTFTVGTGFDVIPASLALQPDGKIIAGGGFTTYQGVSAPSIIRLNADGSRDNTFTVGTGFDSTVFTLAVQSDGKIIAGGGFTIYQDVAAPFIVRLNANGSRDNTFTIGTGFDSIVNTLAVQPDGKVVAGGTFSTYQGVSAPFIVRLNADGSRDNTFAIGAGFNSIVNTLAVQPDGKITVGGNFTTYQGVSAPSIVRLNADGSRDNTFTVGTGFNNGVFTLVLQSDGRTVVGGSFTTYNELAAGCIIRLNTNGSKDSTLVSGTGFAGTVFTLAVQSDGRVLVGGSFATFSDVAANRIIRLNANGSPDNTFVSGTGFNNQVRALAVQSDGKIIVGGAFGTYQGVAANRIIRLNTDGSRDNTFNIGTGFNNPVRALAVQSDGKIIVAGQFTTYQGVAANRIIRLNADGSRDNTFAIGTGFPSTVSILTLQSDGKIIAGGQFITYQGVAASYIVRLNSDGSRDNTFAIGTGFDAIVNTLAVQPDGKVVVGGDFFSYQGVVTPFLIRLNTNGSRDATFATGTGFDDRVTAIAAQSDGKTIVCGDFLTYQGVATNLIIRLNADGSRDNTFTVGTGFDLNATTLALQPDGKILAGGSFNGFDNQPASRLTRFNMIAMASLVATGPRGIEYAADYAGNYSSRSLVDKAYVDARISGATFTGYTASSGITITGGSVSVRTTGVPNVSGLEANASGLTLNISGYTTPNPVSVTTSRTLRLATAQSSIAMSDNPGGRDTTFVMGAGFDSPVNTIALQPDSKALVGGVFTTYQGVSTNRIIRLNSDGSRDNTFVVGVGFDLQVRAIALQPDGKILVGGSFLTYQGISSNRIIRLNADGSRDNTFTVGTGFNNSVNDTVHTITLQPDGKIVVGGSFATYQGVAASNIIRLNADGSRDTGFVVGTGFPTLTLVIALQPDGKIVVGGNFATYQGVAAASIIRLNADGSRDNTFVVGTGFDSTVYAIARQPDGKILVGGTFGTYQGVSANRIIRLNADGSRDTGFVVGTGFFNFVITIAIRPDGKILVGGNFPTYQGVAASGLVRLNADGSRDNTFVVGTGFNDFVNALAFQVDERILVGGSFSSYQDNGVSRIIRLDVKPTHIISGPMGIEYAADYSPQYTPRSLTDKAYVDARVSGVTFASLTQKPVTLSGYGITDAEATVRGTVLTGVDVNLPGTVTGTDTVLQAAGKLQRQVNDSLVPVLSGVQTGTNIDFSVNFQSRTLAASETLNITSFTNTGLGRTVRLELTMGPGSAFALNVAGQTRLDTGFVFVPGVVNLLELRLLPNSRYETFNFPLT